MGYPGPVCLLLPRRLCPGRKTHSVLVAWQVVPTCFDGAAIDRLPGASAQSSKPAYGAEPKEPGRAVMGQLERALGLAQGQCGPACLLHRAACAW